MIPTTEPRGNPSPKEGAASPTRFRTAASALSSASTVRVRAVLSLGMILTLGAVGTFALWSDSATATSGTFSTGIVDLRADAETRAMIGAGSSNTLALSNMLPGESRAATVQVQNTRSTMDVTYTVDASTPPGSPALTGHLGITVFSGGAASNTTTNGMRTGTCTGPRIGSVTLRSGTPVRLVGTARPLSARTGAETLCFVASLATSAPITTQNQNLSEIVFTFNAQTTV